MEKERKRNMPVVVQKYMEDHMKLDIRSAFDWLSGCIIKKSDFLWRRRRDYEEKIRDRVQQETELRIKTIKRKAEEAARKEAEQLLDAFDTELQELQQQVKWAEQEKDELREKIRILSEDSVSRETVALMRGTEQELYEGEIKDIVLQVLSDSLKTIPADTRREDVIKDIIDSNDFRHIGEKKAELLKNTLKSYNGMNKQLRKQLAELGLTIEDGQKHYKIIYHGDSRYMAVIGKTPSDFRAGRNTAAVMCRIFF